MTRTYLVRPRIFRSGPSRTVGMASPAFLLPTSNRIVRGAVTVAPGGAPPQTHAQRARGYTIPRSIYPIPAREEL